MIDVKRSDAYLIERALLRLIAEPTRCRRINWFRLLWRQRLRGRRSNKVFVGPASVLWGVMSAASESYTKS